MRIAPPILALLFATSVNAQEPVFSVEVVEQCERTSPDPYLCIGSAASACIESGGGITAVQGSCYFQELEYWEGVLDKHFQTLGANAQRWDADIAENALVGVAITEEKARDMQRAWTAYRDARCDLVDAIHSGGRGNSPALVACEMRATAEHALVLRAFLESF